jgi:hypothetical protein
MPMAIGRPKAELVLSTAEHAQLSALAASLALPHALVARAKLVPVGGARQEQQHDRWAAGLEPAHGGQIAPALRRTTDKRFAR